MLPFCHRCIPEMPSPNGKVVLLGMPQLAIRARRVGARAKLGIDSAEATSGKLLSLQHRPEGLTTR
jgi:hypothetical protein